MQRRAGKTWVGAWKTGRTAAAHAALFCFTFALAAQLDRHDYYSWWFIFSPLWIFHAINAHGRFSLPAPTLPHGRQWAPCHSIVALPLLVPFELLLCIYLESTRVGSNPPVNLKIVFLPLLAFEVIILVDNFRMCRELMPGDEESRGDGTIWETLPHFWVAISMVFSIAATTFTLLKLSGDARYVSWWVLFVNYGIAECFAFLLCTKWVNPLIQSPYVREAGSSVMSSGYSGLDSAPLLLDMEEERHERICSLANVGGHMMKIPVVVFQILLCMHLEGTPMAARNIPMFILFSPLFVLQGFGLIFATARLVESVVLLLHSGPVSTGYWRISSEVQDCFSFLHYGPKLLGWWSIGDGREEEHSRLFHTEPAGYSTFSSYPPEVVKKMPKKDLAEEIWRLQAALGEQAEISKITKKELERLQNEKILCRICTEGEICMVLIPCHHRPVCRSCAKECQQCPVCDTPVENRMPVFDV